MTERYSYIIFGFNYGAEFNFVMGKSMVEAKAVLPRIIREALIVDDRINDAGSFEFEEIDRTGLKVKFKVESIYGELEEDFFVRTAI